MPSQSFWPVVATNSGAILTLSYDYIQVVGSNAYLVNPTVTWFSKPGLYDNNNTISVVDAGPPYSPPATTTREIHSGRISGGTLAWSVEGVSVPLSASGETFRDFAVRVTNLSLFVGDNASRVFIWPIAFPRYVPPDPGPSEIAPVQSIGSLRDKRIVVYLPPTRKQARLWIPSNGKPIRLYVRGTRGVSLYEHYPMSRRRQIIVDPFAAPGKWDAAEISGPVPVNETSFAALTMNKASQTMGTALIVIGDNANGYVELTFLYED